MECACLLGNGPAQACRCALPGNSRVAGWTARWIDCAGYNFAASVENKAVPVPDGDNVPYLRKSVKLADKSVKSARLYVTALGLYEMFINGKRVGDIVFALNGRITVNA